MRTGLLLIGGAGRAGKKDRLGVDLGFFFCYIEDENYLEIVAGLWNRSE